MRWAATFVALPRLDGMVIEPGDLVIGAEDGVLCVAFAEAAAALAVEQKQMASIQAGTYDPAWIDQTLRRLEYERVD